MEISGTYLHKINLTSQTYVQYYHYRSLDFFNISTESFFLVFPLHLFSVQSHLLFYYELIYVNIFSNVTLNGEQQRRISNPVKHLQWSFFVGFQPLNTFAKSSIVDFQLGSKYTSEQHDAYRQPILHCPVKFCFYSLLKNRSKQKPTHQRVLFITELKSEK